MLIRNCAATRKDAYETKESLNQDIAVGTCIFITIRDISHSSEIQVDKAPLLAAHGLEREGHKGKYEHMVMLALMLALMRRMLAC